MTVPSGCTVAVHSIAVRSAHDLTPAGAGGAWGGAERPRCGTMPPCAWLWPCLKIRGHARRLSGRGPRRVRRPARRAVRPAGRAADGGAGALAGAPEPGAGPPPGPGQLLRRAGRGRDRRPRPSSGCWRRPRCRWARTSRPLYAVDGSVWARCDAETSPERGFYHHPSRHSNGQPIVAGWLYQWVAQVRLTRRQLDGAAERRAGAPGRQRQRGGGRAGPAGRGAPPGRRPAPAVRLRRRLRPGATGPAARPGRRRCPRGPPRAAAQRPLLLRRPAARTPARGRAARRHGREVRLRRPGDVVGAGRRAHRPTTPATAGCGCGPGRASTPRRRSTRRGAPTGRAPIERGTLLLLQVERLPRQTRAPKDVWLWWQGPPGTAPDLAVVWRAYVHRFDLEHTFRFCKERSAGPPRACASPPHADRWTWLVALAYTQLRLAQPARRRPPPALGAPPARRTG